MSIDQYRLGIDFGTSTTVAVLARSDGSIEPLLFDASPLLPSAVYADPGGRLLVGADALRAGLADPERCEPHPKRRIDDGVVLLGGTEVAVVELITAVLVRVVDQARRVTGGELPEAVLTYPAWWGAQRCGLLRAAAESAGLGRVGLVAEPVAAAAYFTAVGGARLPVGALLLVYDLGAGTFDAALVRRTSDGFDVLATRELAGTGGLDLDAAIAAHFGATYGMQNPALWQRLAHPVTIDDQRAAWQLRERVRTGKEALSRLGSTLVRLPLLEQDAPLGREQLEELARPLVDRTVAATRAVLAEAGVSSSVLAGVFLVGGASRLPLIGTALQRDLGVAPTVIEQPDLVVAQGSSQTAATALPATALPAMALPVTGPPAAARRRRRIGVFIMAIVVVLVITSVGLIWAANRPRAATAAQAVLHVFLKLDATAADRDAIESTLKASPRVRSVRFVNRQEAYQRFMSDFHSYSDLTRSVRPDTLPESFVATLFHPTDYLPVATQVRGLSGIDTVIGTCFDPAAPTPIGYGAATCPGDSRTHS